MYSDRGHMRAGLLRASQRQTWDYRLHGRSLRQEYPDLARARGPSVGDFGPYTWPDATLVPALGWMSVFGVRHRPVPTAVWTQKCHDSGHRAPAPPRPRPAFSLLHASLPAPTTSGPVCQLETSLMLCLRIRVPFGGHSTLSLSPSPDASSEQVTEALDRFLQLCDASESFT